jgi:glycine dehydrogenase subunit 2
MYRQASYDEPLLNEISNESDNGYFPDEKFEVPEVLKRKELNIPQISENRVVRHFLRLSQMNYGVDTGFYPLGSCTMKYNPKYSEEIAGWSEVGDIHPYQDERTVQGALRIMYELQNYLAEIGGMDAVTLQPAAGAHGEFTGLRIIRAYHEFHGNDRDEVIVPDSAHGTNPASAAMNGFKVIEIESKNGMVDLEALEAALSEKTAAFMLTNPNTLGIFEENVVEIAKMVHDAGALLYYDGANLNAIMGITNPGKMGFDVMHFNLHKTFSTPHGGGGPGSGPVGVKEHLKDFLPVPIVDFDGERYFFNYDIPHSIGKVRAYYGNFAVFLKAWLYIRRLGPDGLKRASERAVLNSNYLKAILTKHIDMPYKELRKHEFVLSGEKLKEKGLRTLDLSKRLLDYGFHAPTIYFPHLVHESIMIEPTESESKAELDAFAEAFIEILKEAEENPEVVRSAPHNTAVKRVDDVTAARNPVLSWKDR